MKKGVDPDPELDPDPDPDPLVRGTDPGIRIRIHIKMSRILYTGLRFYQLYILELSRSWLEAGRRAGLRPDLENLRYFLPPRRCSSWRRDSFSNLNSRLTNFFKP
jgi:hypothetical protein